MTPGPRSHDNAQMVFGDVPLDARNEAKPKRRVHGRGTSIQAVAALLGLLIGGCATQPPPPPPPAPVVVAPASAPVCAVCEDTSAEMASLRQELALRESELRDLRAQQRDQARVLKETAKQASRAKVKLRRLATQADAASYVAEVEVALDVARSAPGAPSRAPLIALAQAVLEASAAPFAQGDYGVAMDLAEQADELVALIAVTPARPASGARATAETRFDVTIRFRAASESHLRRQPGDKAPSLGVVREGTRLTTTAHRDGWFKVETEDGRAGWIHQSVVAAP